MERNTDGLLDIRDDNTGIKNTVIAATIAKTEPVEAADNNSGTGCSFIGMRRMAENVDSCSSSDGERLNIGQFNALKEVEERLVTLNVPIRKVEVLCCLASENFNVDDGLKRYLAFNNDAGNNLALTITASSLLENLYSKKLVLIPSTIQMENSRPVFIFNAGNPYVLNGLSTARYLLNCAMLDEPSFKTILGGVVLIVNMEGCSIVRFNFSYVNRLLQFFHSGYFGNLHSCLVVNVGWMLSGVVLACLRPFMTPELQKKVKVVDNSGLDRELGSKFVSEHFPASLGGKSSDPDIEAWVNERVSIESENAPKVSICEDEKKKNDVDQLVNEPAIAETTSSLSKEDIETETTSVEQQDSKDSDDVIDETLMNRLEELHKKRTHIAYEILETERTYVSDLSMVMSLFAAPLRESNILSGKDAQLCIPANLKSVVKINKQLLSVIEERLAKWEVMTCIGDAFCDVMSKFEVYVSFVSQYQGATRHLQSTITKVPAFSRWLREMEKRPECRRMGLSEHLFCPVQRIPRYVMLLKDLAKRTDLGHPDHAAINRALTQMRDLAGRINDRKREVDGCERMLEIAQCVRGLPEVPPLVQPRRRFEKEEDFVQLDVINDEYPSTFGSGAGTVVVRTGHAGVSVFDQLAASYVDDDSDKSSVGVGGDTDIRYRFRRNVTLFLFSDIILLVKRKGKRTIPSIRDQQREEDYKYIQTANLGPRTKIKIFDMPDCGETKNIFHFSSPPEPMVVLQAATAAIKASWLSHFAVILGPERVVLNIDDEIDDDDNGYVSSNVSSPISTSRERSEVAKRVLEERSASMHADYSYLLNERRRKQQESNGDCISLNSADVDINASIDDPDVHIRSANAKESMERRTLTLINNPGYLLDERRKLLHSDSVVSASEVEVLTSPDLTK